MTFTFDRETVLVFDLDDTLYKETDYLRSAFREIAALLEKDTGHDLFDEMITLNRSGKEVFGNIINRYGIKTRTKGELLFIYRNHFPDITLPETTARKLEEFRQAGITMGVITDGYSVTQRNKLLSLGIHDLFDEIVISEEFGSCKPNIKNYKYMEDRLQGKDFVFIGDNPGKDFIAPSCLGWSTVCLLDNGSNIHPQKFTLNNALERPQVFIKDFNELKLNSPEKSILENLPAYLEIG